MPRIVDDQFLIVRYIASRHMSMLHYYPNAGGGAEIPFNPSTFDIGSYAYGFVMVDLCGQGNINYNSMYTLLVLSSHYTNPMKTSKNREEASLQVFNQFTSQ